MFEIISNTLVVKGSSMSKDWKKSDLDSFGNLIVSVFIEFRLVFGLFLYNTWIENTIFRTFYPFIFPPLGTIAAFLMYKSFGKELE